MLKIENIQRIKGYCVNIKGFDFNVTDVNENLDSYIFTLKARLTVHAPKTMILKKQCCELGYYEMQEYGYPRYHLWQQDMLSPASLRDEFQKYLNAL
jgi:hypothetical protein